MDPGVSKALFDGEVEEMRERALFKSGCWAIISASHPDLVVELPHPSGARRRFRLRCDDWDERAPSVTSVDADSTELPGEPTGNFFMGLKTGWGLCAPGTREYHTHHAENPWANHRATLSLAAIVFRVAAFYRKASP